VHIRLILCWIVFSPLGLMAADNPLNLKEGLWEVTVTHSGSGMPGMSEDVLAKLPPEQRAKIEEMMKQRGASMNGNTTVVKSCVTKEKIAKGMAFGENRENCSHNIVNSSPSHVEIKMHCEENKNGGKTTMDGTTSVDLIGSDNAKGSTHVVTNSNGKTMTTDLTFTSKYLGAACGDVK